MFLLQKIFGLHTVDEDTAFLVKKEPTLCKGDNSSRLNSKWLFGEEEFQNWDQYLTSDCCLQ